MIVYKSAAKLFMGHRRWETIWEANRIHCRVFNLQEYDQMKSIKRAHIAYANIRTCILVHGKKNCSGEREEILHQSNFTTFPQNFNCSSMWLCLNVWDTLREHINRDLRGVCTRPSSDNGTGKPQRVIWIELFSRRFIVSRHCESLDLYKVRWRRKANTLWWL